MDNVEEVVRRPRTLTEEREVSDSAVISGCGMYRYRLSRGIGVTGDEIFGTCCFVMLNPSTADAINNDPTIRRCIAYSRRFGCHRLEVVNLFAYRAANPQNMFDVAEAGVDIIGPSNDEHIIEVCNASRLIICAWGNHGARYGRSTDVLRLIRAQHGAQPMALKLNKTSKQPAHPLYQKSDALLIEVPK